MSLIFNCAVDSEPARIRFRWVGKFALTASDSFLLEDSTVQALGNGKQSLEGWRCTALQIIAPPPGAEESAHAYHVEMSADAKAKFRPAAGEALEFVIAVKNPSGGRHPKAEARAIVDSEQDPVVLAIQDVGNQISSQVSAGVGMTRDGLQQLSDQVVKGLTEARGDFETLTGYAFQVTDSAGPSVLNETGGVAGNAGAVIDTQMRAVLGRTPGRGGTAGTLAALDRSFSLQIVDGVETWVTTAPYALQPDIGNVTGEAASLARLGAAVAAEVIPLVQDLSPLVLEANVPLDQVEAAEAIFVSSLPLFNAELARSSGPRRTRARGLLKDLTSQLDTLGVLFGMFGSSQNGGSLTGTRNPSREFVINDDDERNYTNFVIARNRVTLLSDQFDALYGTGALSPPGPSLPPTDRGTLVYFLQQALDATDEAADMASAAFRSVNLGDDELGLILVDPSDPRSDSFADVLDIAAQLHVEAGSLLHDGGTLGADTVGSRATSVRDEVQRMILDNGQRPPGWPLGVAHPRVQVAVTVLRDRLANVIANAEQLAPPVKA